MLKTTMRVLLPVLSLVLALPLAARATGQDAQEAKPATVAAKTAGMRHIDGFVPLDWDAKSGKLYFEVARFNQDILYLNSLPWGVGSNDLGLDRGQLGKGVVVQFRRVGPKVLLVEPNLAFRSGSTQAAEQLAVRQSFPESVLFGFTVTAEDPGGAVLVDATDFVVRDAHHVAETLASLKQGAYRLDASRSAVSMEETRGFPRNTEFEALLTFADDAPPQGNFVGDVTPDEHAMTVHEHQSFLALPGPGFRSRRFDPRAGYFPGGYRDYTTPLGDRLDQQFILRHRLVKKDPACKTACEPLQPIQYYVDRGAPEPIQSALLEGARWWNQAFTAAGWKDAFRVDLLPEDADPMDVRYNIIQWVHRYTRGWSYGEAVADPRTGEIIKGNVTLGSLRARQDYLIAEALLAPYGDDKAAPGATDAARNPMLAMVLARIRQLAAHETGHTLGLAHNFAASAYAQSASVMDYPHPLVALDAAGVPDLAHAYAVNIGEWDKVAIAYGYAQFSDKDNEAADLDKVINDSIKRGLYFITDEDARPLGSAHPHAHLWDNGNDSAAELDRILAVRSAALKRFGLHVIKARTPVAQLEDALVVLYLMHRYQLEAAAKEVGGLDYRYALRGDGQKVADIVAPADQRKALAAILRTLTPAANTLPESLLQILPPLPPGLERTRESFASKTGLTFDPVTAAESSADLTLGLLLNPQRAARLVQYHARDARNPGLDEVLDALLRATWLAPQEQGLARNVQAAIDMRALEAMLALLANPSAPSEVHATVRSKIAELRIRLQTGDAVAREAVARIDTFDRDPTKFIPAKPVEVPPGMPIGDTE